jgi:hypothetical protein
MPLTMAKVCSVHFHSDSRLLSVICTRGKWPTFQFPFICSVPVAGKGLNIGCAEIQVWASTGIMHCIMLITLSSQCIYNMFYVS